ncbi:MAG: CorA family divalent cation transporter [Vibrionaceae bacterium]
MNSFIINSWNFNNVRPIANSSVPASIESGNWYHCQRDNPQFRQWLHEIALPEAIIEAMLTSDTRPRFEMYSDDCFLINLRGINLNDGADPDDMLSVRMLWYKDALISTRKMSSRAIASVVSKLEQGAGPTSLPALVTAIFSGINQIIADFIAPIEDKIDALIDAKDEQNLDEPQELVSRLLHLNRYLKPQRYVFEDLLACDVEVLKSEKSHFKNTLDGVIRINESITFYLEQLNLFVQTQEQRQAHMMNRNTYLFSIIAGIFLPASFFTGLFGVNIAGMPGTDRADAFFLFCLGIVLVAVVEIIILKKLKFI